MSSAAQEEVDRLFNQKERLSHHPEDSDSASDSNPSDNERDRYEIADDEADDDEDYYADKMVSKTSSYQIPNTNFNANTGPKGVIADAQSFERARKRSFRRTLLNAAGLDGEQPFQRFKEANRTSRSRSASTANSVSDEEERFMRQWRENRMRELETRGRRKRSPSKRVFGTVDTVDASGYLDAVEKVAEDTIVVVCIYDPESTESGIVEDCLTTLARKNPTTHFIKLHHQIAEMEHVGAPALLAYRGGDVFVTIIDIFRQIPNGRSCSPASLEDLLKANRVL